MRGINITIKEIKKKAAEYYKKNSDLIRHKARNMYRSLPEKEKNKKINIKEKDTT